MVRGQSTENSPCADFVPKFIESAKACERWQDWDQDLFYEFFERGGDQCVSSLKQGYFTDEEKTKIKDDWNELAPMLKAIAESQDSPKWDVYEEIKVFIRQRTNQNRMAATNRLIASLQPNLLCTIVKESRLVETFNLMRNVGRRGNSPWIAPAPLTKYLSTTEHEERQVTDSMHLCSQPLYL